MKDYQEAIAYLNVDSPNEEIDEFKVCVAQTIAELEEAIAAEDAGDFDEEEADAAIAEALLDHHERAMDIFDLEEVETARYSGHEGSNIASFSEGLGSVLAGLIAEEYETPDDGIADLVDATGSDRETIEAIVAGDAVPDLIMGEQMASVFDSLQNDENSYKEWNSLVSRAYGEVSADAGIAPEVEKDTTLAAMSAQQNALLAEFSQMKSDAELNQELRALNLQAQNLVEQGILTPFEQKDLLGEFNEAEDRLALFSQACEVNNTPPQVQLDRVKFYLHMRQRCGKSAMFSEMSDREELPSYSLSEQDQAFVSEIVDEVIG